MRHTWLNARGRFINEVGETVRGQGVNKDDWNAEAEKKAPDFVNEQ